MRLAPAALCLGLVLLWPASAASGQAAGRDIDKVLRDLGGEAIRDIAFDVCFPANSEEYEALGKHAVLQLTTRTAIATELPLRSVYVLHKGVRIQLQRIHLGLRMVESGSGQASQISYYLLPIQLMKADSQVLADFTGARKAFGITSFSAKGGLGQQAPAFARLDEYDDPSEADLKTVAELLAREYPGDIE